MPELRKLQGAQKSKTLKIMEITANMLLGALIEQGSEPTLIETDEDAQAWADEINGAEYPAAECTDPEELAEIAPLLNLKAKRLHKAYAFTSGSAGYFALSSDWDFPPTPEEYAEAEGLDTASTCNNGNGYPSGLRYAVTGFSDFEEAEKAAAEIGGEIIEIYRRDGRDLWTRGGRLWRPFEFSGEMFGDSYAVYDDAGTYWREQREFLAERLADNMDLDELVQLVGKIQDTRDALEDLNEGESLLCLNEEGAYVYYDKLNNMSYEHDGCRHTVAVIAKPGR